MRSMTSSTMTTMTTRILGMLTSKTSTTTPNNRKLPTPKMQSRSSWRYQVWSRRRAIGASKA